MARLSVTETAARNLQDMILSGELAPNQRLPSQAELSRQLGLSRPSLREALSTLETLGFLRIEPGRGTFVATNTPSTSGQLGVWPSGGRYSREDIYLVRMHLEGTLAGLVASVASAALVDALTQLAAAMRDAWTRQDLIGVVDADTSFHQRIWEASPNVLLRDLCFGLATEFAATRSYPLPATRAARFLESSSEHFAIIAAIGASDAPGAIAIMQAHIRKTAAAAGITLPPA